MKMPKKFSERGPSHNYSIKQEKEFAKEVGAKQTIASGRLNVKGDSRSKHFYYDNKCTIHDSYSIKLSDIREAIKNSMLFKQSPVFQLSFITKQEKVREELCILRKADFILLLERAGMV